MLNEYWVSASLKLCGELLVPNISEVNIFTNLMACYEKKSRYYTASNTNFDVL